MYHVRARGEDEPMINVHYYYFFNIEISSVAPQVCEDVNECEDGNNGGCVANSECINTEVGICSLSLSLKKIYR